MSPGPGPTSTTSAPSATSSRAHGMICPVRISRHISLAHSSRCPSFMRRRYGGSGVASRAYPANQCRPAATSLPPTRSGSGRSRWPVGRASSSTSTTSTSSPGPRAACSRWAPMPSTWVLPPSRALWIPAGLPHTVAVAVASAQMYSLYFTPSHAPVHWTEPTVVSVSPLLGELILHLSDPDGARRASPARGGARVRSARPDRRRAVAHAGAERRTGALRRRRAHRGSGRRTHARGVGTRGGCERADAQPALRRRDRDSASRSGAPRRVSLPRSPSSPTARPIASVGTLVGYANPSAFIAAFRRVFGVTPGSYFDRPGGPAAAIADLSDFR